MSLGNKIRELREAQGWTQGQLAVKANVKRAYINAIEHSRVVTPGADRLVLLARALGVDEDELLEAAGFKNPLSSDKFFADQVSGLASNLSEGRKKQALSFLRFLFHEQQQEDVDTGTVKMRSKEVMALTPEQKKAAERDDAYARRLQEQRLKEAEKIQNERKGEKQTKQNQQHAS